MQSQNRGTRSGEIAEVHFHVLFPYVSVPL